MINKITIFELTKRLDLLIETKGEIVSYLNNLRPGLLHAEETQESLRLRQAINFKLKRIIISVADAGAPTSFFYSPPPSLGGFCGNIEIFSNFFNLENNFHISPQIAIDSLDQAIGSYAAERPKALRRTLNPFWWAWLFLGWLAGLPFFVLREIGFNISKFENSFLGKFIKLIIATVVLVAAILPLLQALGYQDGFIRNIKVWFRLP